MSAGERRPAPSPGQLWRHRREGWRTLEVTAIRELDSGEVLVYVRRNTSNRRGAVNLRTLHRDYQLR